MFVGRCWRFKFAINSQLVSSFDGKLKLMSVLPVNNLWVLCVCVCIWVWVHVQWWYTMKWSYLYMHCLCLPSWCKLAHKWLTLHFTRVTPADVALYCLHTHLCDVIPWVYMYLYTGILPLHTCAIYLNVADVVYRYWYNRL